MDRMILVNGGFGDRGEKGFMMGEVFWCLGRGNFQNGGPCFYCLCLALPL
jgi:hypothetical protein